MSVEAYVLVVRRPDVSDGVMIDGTAHVVDVDLATTFRGRPGDYATAVEFALGVLALDPVPVSSPVFAAALDVYREALREWPLVVTIIDEYVAERTRKA